MDNFGAMEAALKNLNAKAKANKKKNPFNLSSMTNALNNIPRQSRRNAIAALEKSAKDLKNQLRKSQTELKMLKNTRRALNHATRLSKRRTHNPS